MVDAVGGEAENRLCDDEAYIVLQTFMQPVAPMRLAVAIAGLPADPYSTVLAQLDGCGRDVVCPQIERAAGAQVKAGVMPVASQNAVFDRAAVQWEAEMGTAIVEREDTAPIVHDEQRTRAAGDDHHPLGLQLVQGASADQFLAAKLLGSLADRFGHRRSSFR